MLPEATVITTAIVGAGLAGLTCARALAASGRAVTVFDKGRRPGGRVATRQSRNDPTWQFDHGAQFFTARSPAFEEVLAEWERSGVIAPWSPRFAVGGGGELHERFQSRPRYVGTPHMAALMEWLARDLRVEAGQPVARIARVDAGWVLTGAEGGERGPWDELVLAVPAEQARALVADLPELRSRIPSGVLEPCFAVMVELATPLPIPFDALRGRGGPIVWMAREGSKPGRPPGERWIIHASAGWSEAHLDDAPGDVEAALLGAASALLGEPIDATRAEVHRWRFAQVAEWVEFNPQIALDDPTVKIAVAGDWLVGPRVEGAWRSGTEAAARVAKW
jgi:predicted NAD/FAD-dependent oxidoreductase